MVKQHMCFQLVKASKMGVRTLRISGPPIKGDYHPEVDTSDMIAGDKLSR